MVQLEADQGERKVVVPGLAEGGRQRLLETPLVQEPRQLVMLRQADKVLIRPLELAGARHERLLGGDDSLRGLQCDVQLAVIDRLGQEVIRAGAQALEALVTVSFRGQQNDVNIGRLDLGSDLATEIQSVHYR